jgi:DNA-directed RNA polymerase specialized sigma24 family protein
VEVDAAEFERFVATVEPGLRRALVATFGPVDGRQAVVDALSWAWEHWDRIGLIERPGAYLYRVGQTAVTRQRPRPVAWPGEGVVAPPEVEPELVAALRSLSDQQRASVLLVHAHGWTQRAAAEQLGVSVSTLREHLARGLERLRALMEVDHVG